MAATVQILSHYSWPSVSSESPLSGNLRQHHRLHVRIFSRRCYITRANFFSNVESSRDSHGADLQNLLLEHAEVTKKFIDYKIMDALSQTGGYAFRQVILVTSGIDDRTHRLPWPPMTIIFHISTSPTKMGRNNVPKSCLVQHICAEVGIFEGSELWMESLRIAGYQGDKPSMWVMQGIDSMDPTKLKKILEDVGSLAMKGSFVVGELPYTLIGGLGKDAGNNLLETLFMSCGFRIKSISYHEHTDSDGIMFYAEQLRLSEDQVNKVRREIELAEELGDEENFEDW